MSDQWPRYVKTTDSKGWVRYVRIWGNGDDPTNPYVYDGVDDDSYATGLNFGDSMFECHWVESSRREFEDAVLRYKENTHG